MLGPGALLLAAAVAAAVLLTGALAREDGTPARAQPQPRAPVDPGSSPLPAVAFPVQGTFHFGRLGVNRFQGPGGHQGQDVFAHCGARLVAARAGRVRERKKDGAAGNYLTVRRADGRGDYVYMHLKRRAAVRKGDHVVAGQIVGQVGKTGDADGCHLHLELWPRDRYRGRPRNPLPELRRLHRANRGRARASDSAALGSQ